MRELDRKLRTDQSPVVDDGDQVAEVDQPSPVTSKMQGSWQSAWSQGGHAHQVPPAASQLSVVVWTQTSLIQHALSLRAAIHFGTRRTTGPDAVVVLAAFKLGDIVDAVVGTIIWILEAASHEDPCTHRRCPRRSDRGTKPHQRMRHLNFQRCQHSSTYPNLDLRSSTRRWVAWRGNRSTNKVDRRTKHHQRLPRT